LFFSLLGTSKIKIIIITVNFGDTSPTENLVESLKAFRDYDNISLYIADNQTTPESFDLLNKLKKTSRVKITIFPNKKNLFYWPAAKKIISLIRESSIKLPDWILICNNDITFSDKLFFKNLKSIDSKRYPIIGPDILNDLGDHLNPFMLKPLNTIQKTYWKLYFSSYLISKILLLIKILIDPILSMNKKIKSEKKQIVYSVHGSAILFSSHFFDSGGWLDGNFDLYGEELSVSEIAKKVSSPIAYFPNLKIKHHEHSITKSSNKKLLYEKARQSYFYLNAKYFKK
tara:strand:- start:86 stop:943 length:858 start_codon:yes stop_codon:yes gene_type:complete